MAGEQVMRGHVTCFAGSQLSMQRLTTSQSLHNLYRVQQSLLSTGYPRHSEIVQLDPKILFLFHATDSMDRAAMQLLQNLCSMISECFNPSCHRALKYLRDGRVVRIIRDEPGDIRVEHFWLCGSCHQQMTSALPMIRVWASHPG
jgi:hypothetical protein